MAGNKSKKTKSECDLDQLVQSSFGGTNSQLLKLMQEAEETVGDDQIPPEPEDGFEQLMVKMEQRGVKPYSEKKAPKDREATEKKKPRALRALVRVALAATILGSVLAMTSITAGAKRGYKFKAKTRISVNEGVVLNTTNDIIEEDRLNSAYTEIENTIGINVLKLGDRPADFRYIKTAINKQRATMYFTYKDEMIYLIQQVGTMEQSTNYVSDRLEKNSVYNVWLQESIMINRAAVDETQTEFSIQLIKGNAQYYLVGIVEEDLFKEIVQDLNFKK